MLQIPFPVQMNVEWTQRPRHPRISELQMEEQPLSLVRTDSTVLGILNGRPYNFVAPRIQIIQDLWKNLYTKLWKISNNIECRHTWLRYGKLCSKNSCFQKNKLDVSTQSQHTGNNFVSILMKLPDNILEKIIVTSYSL